MAYGKGVIRSSFIPMLIFYAAYGISVGTVLHPKANPVGPDVQVARSIGKGIIAPVVATDADISKYSIVVAITEAGHRKFQW